MKAARNAKTDEWNLRSSTRAEGQGGINKALEVLISDEARQIFSKAIKPGFETFLQVSSESGRNTTKFKAYNAPKRAAGKSRSLRLAALAATVRSAGAFKVVIDEIDKMMQVLKDEEAADIEQRGWCKDETFKKEQEKSRYEYKIEKTEAKIVKLTEKKEELEDASIASRKEIDQTHVEFSAMENTRTQEHIAVVEAKDMDEKAIELLKMAIDLSGFYKKNEIDMGAIQGSLQFFQQGPIEGRRPALGRLAPPSSARTSSVFVLSLRLFLPFSTVAPPSFSSCSESLRPERSSSLLPVVWLCRPLVPVRMCLALSPISHVHSPSLFLSLSLSLSPSLSPPWQFLTV